MGFSLGKYIDKLFGGDPSKMSDEEFAERVAEIQSHPRNRPAMRLDEVPDGTPDIPIGMSSAEMWETYGVYHVRWEVADGCACTGCKKMSGAIFDHWLARLVDERRHSGCRCHWVPIDVLRGRQKIDCLLPDADIRVATDLLTRVYEAEKLFPGYTPAASSGVNPKGSFGYGPAKILAPSESLSGMDGYYLIDCIAETEKAGASTKFLISLYEAAETKRVSPNTKAKVCKRIGELLLELGEREKALAAFNRALGYNPKAPVKRLISQAEKQL